MLGVILLVQSAMECYNLEGAARSVIAEGKGSKVDDAVFLVRLTEACRQIDSLPEDQQASLRALLAEARERHAELKVNFARIHDALEDWRIKMKYLVFDLEATRREVAELRRRQKDEDTEDRVQ